MVQEATGFGPQPQVVAVPPIALVSLMVMCTQAHEPPTTTPYVYNPAFKYYFKLNKSACIRRMNFVPFV